VNRVQAQALVERQARTWENGEVVALLADFAPDGVLIAPAAAGRVTTPYELSRRRSSRRPQIGISPSHACCSMAMDLERDAPRRWAALQRRGRDYLRAA
jgi:hypothetical protein